MDDVIIQALRSDDAYMLARAGIRAFEAFADRYSGGALHSAIMANSRSCVQWLINDNHYNIGLTHYLQIAAIYADISIVKILVRAGADVRACTGILWNTLSLRRLNVSDVARYLIKHGATYGERRKWNSIVRTHQGEFERSVQMCRRVMGEIMRAGRMRKCGWSADLALYFCKHFVWPKRKSKIWRRVTAISPKRLNTACL